MNRTCCGEYFLAGRKKYWQCLGDGSLLVVDGFPNTCPSCNRKVGREITDFGHIPMVHTPVLEVYQVVFVNGKRIVLNKIES